MCVMHSPYEHLVRRHIVETVQEKAARFAGYSVFSEDEPLKLPPQLLRELPSFAMAVMRVCRSHLALEEIHNALPDAEPHVGGDDDG